MVCVLPAVCYTKGLIKSYDKSHQLLDGKVLVLISALKWIQQGNTDQYVMYTARDDGFLLTRRHCYCPVALAPFHFLEGVGRRVAEAT